MSATPTVRVRIKTATHTHQDELVAPGTVLDDISPATARHLAEIGVAEILSGPALAPVATTSSTTGGAN